VLSLAELRRVVRALDASRAGARIDRVLQPAADDVALLLAGGAERPARDRVWLRLCCRPGLAHLGTVAEGPPAPATTPGFGQFLRAHLAGGRLAAAALRGEDRQALLRVETREGGFALLLSFLGPRSNLYLLDERDGVVASARPLAETRRELAPGEPWRDPQGGPPGEGGDRFADVEGEALLAAVGRHYAEAEVKAGSANARARLARALAKARTALEKKAARLEAEARDGEEAVRLGRLGELLKASLASVRPGASEVVARDFASGEAVAIPLDPARTPAANLEDLFRRARKAARRAEKAVLELGALHGRIEELRGLEHALDAAQDDAALAALAARPEVARLLARNAPQAAPAGRAAARPKRRWQLGRREVPARLAPKVYRTRDGLEIWVGRSDEGNDLLTTRLARGNDLFFHLEGSPGSHVILRTEGRGEAPQESLLEAAELAVHFSKARGASRASVHVAAVKDVSKPPGAKSGLVWVHRGRTIGLRHSPERLQRLLDSRDED
jgi:predicted ribosome quality control (RQC) complex YloA/Tae2 family protein